MTIVGSKAIFGGMRSCLQLDGSSWLNGSSGLDAGSAWLNDGWGLAAMGATALGCVGGGVSA